MIPILFKAHTKSFTTKGIGQLADCISCLVTEERNGEYEVEFEYPVTGKHYADILDDSIVYVTHDNSGDKQPFKVYAKSAPLDGVVTFNAHHISYELSDVIVKPFTASSAAATMTKFTSESMTDNPFTFWTDKSVASTFNLTAPSSTRSVLGGVQGSVLDVYGGEYEFDNYTVKLYTNRGSDKGVTVRYAKNLTELEQNNSVLGKYNAIVPYWAGEDTVVYGDPVVAKDNGRRLYNDVWTNQNDVAITNQNNVEFDFDYYENHSITMDFSSDFQTKPTKEQLEAKAAAYLNNNVPWIPQENIKFNFADLWSAGEGVPALSSVRLCDTVTVKYTALGVSAKAKVIKTVWNPLIDEYDELEVGEARTSFAQTIAAETGRILESYPKKSDMDNAIEHATTLITGGMGGHVVFAQDAEGKPTEIFVMDTEDTETAVHVLRINVNGIGFSSNGINGPFTTAWTLDGSFVADFITAGTLSANRIRAGTLQSMDGSSYWDLDGSEFVFTDPAFDSWVKLDEGYIEFGHGNEVFGRIIRMLRNGKDILAIQANSTGDIISIGPDGAHIVHGNTNLYVGTSVRILKGDSMIRMYDDSSSQFIDMNSGGNNYIRLDGKDNRVWIRGGTLMTNGYKAYDGKITIGDNTLTFHNGILTGST